MVTSTPTRIAERPRFVEEPTALRKMPKNLAMRLAGRMSVGLNAVFGSRANDRMGILMYHRVADRVPGLPAPLHNVEPARFREQLTGLKQRGYQFWPLRKALKCHYADEPIPARTVLVTFDDGFQSVYTEAYPVLKQLKIPATIFVNTSYLNSDEPFPFDAWGVAYAEQSPAASFRPLTTEQCHEMLAEGLIDIGAHTHTHADHRGRPDDFRNDVQQSVDFIHKQFRINKITFAFPYGGRHTGFASDELAHAARKTGVVCGLTTNCQLVDPNNDPFRWGRFNAFSWDTSTTLNAKLNGWYSWAPKINQRLGRAAKLG